MFDRRGASDAVLQNMAVARFRGRFALEYRRNFGLGRKRDLTEQLPLVKEHGIMMHTQAATIVFLAAGMTVLGDPAASRSQSQAQGVKNGAAVSFGQPLEQV